MLIIRTLIFFNYQLLNQMNRMPRIPISRTRFRWKSEPWKEIANIQSVWMYCQKGILSFELEIDPSILLPKNRIALADMSIHKHLNNFIRVRDPRIISQIGSKVKSLTLKGAVGKGVYLGTMELIIDGSGDNIPIFSTLFNWKEWNEYINLGVPNL